MGSINDVYLNAVNVLAVSDEVWKRCDGVARASFFDCKVDVLSAYQPAFNSSGIARLTKGKFESFLQHENNRHWSGLHRQAPRLCQDMRSLRKNLGMLLNEALPISDRVTNCISDTHGMGKAICTAILLVAFPESYGVWNSKSESAMRRLGILPQFERGMSIGSQYQLINQVLVRLAADLNTDLWCLDALLWNLNREPFPSDALADIDACSRDIQMSRLTERESLVLSRIGQGCFREDLKFRWGGCSVTGLSDPYLLKASHIKPWRYCSNEERLDPENGLLLHPALDHLFDIGLITFLDNGQIRVAKSVSKENLKILGISRSMKLRAVTEEMTVYLRYHRDFIFCDT